MSRVIKFRGQTRRKGEYLVNMAGDKCDSNWVYGGIFPQNRNGDFAVIYQQEPKIEKFTVYADTVGQYTGLHDTTSWEELSEDEKEIFLLGYNYKKDRQNIEGDWKGKEIYEWDIVSFTHNIEILKNRLLMIPSVYEEYTRNYVVEFVNTYCTYGLRARNKSIHFKLSQATINTHNVKVIGNIHDNSELLEEREV